MICCENIVIFSPKKIKIKEFYYSRVSNLGGGGEQKNVFNVFHIFWGVYYNQ